MKLKSIAQTMISFARKHPDPAGDLSAYRQPLPRGLVVMFVIVAAEYRLALSRATVWPSKMEETICRAAFEVPDHAQRQATQKGDYYHVVYTWGDDPPDPPIFKRLVYPGGATWLAVPAGSWQRLAGGQIRVDYPDPDSLFWSVTVSQIAREVEQARRHAEYQQLAQNWSIKS